MVGNHLVYRRMDEQMDRPTDIRKTNYLLFIEGGGGHKIDKVSRISASETSAGFILALLDIIFWHLLKPI